MTKRFAMLIIVSTLILTTAAKCATSSSDYCRYYKPVPTLDHGTVKQIDNVDKNNATYLELGCLDG